MIRHGDKRYVIKDHTAFSEEYVSYELICNLLMFALDKQNKIKKESGREKMHQ